jgi:hypothetical protein
MELCGHHYGAITVRRSFKTFQRFQLWDQRDDSNQMNHIHLNNDIQNPASMHQSEEADSTQKVSQVHASMCSAIY